MQVYKNKNQSTDMFHSIVMTIKTNEFFKEPGASLEEQISNSPTKFSLVLFWQTVINPLFKVDF